jgi:hypothetical protein
MATENIIFKVLFDTTDATKQVASLDGVMENATKQVDEFTKNVKGGAEGLSNLAKAKKTFNDISIAESTNEIKELSSELSNATAKEKDFGKAGKETVDAYKKGKIDQVQATKQLGDAIDKGVVATQKMATETEKVGGKLKSYKAQVMELKQILPTLSGQEYVDAQAKLAHLTDAMGDQQAQIKLLASDTRALDTAMQGLQLGVGVFAGLQGAAALFGSENEDVQKALLKVNGAMAVLQSLQAIQNTLDAESGFVNSVKLYWQNLFNASTETSIILAEENIVATEGETAATGLYGIALRVVTAIQTQFGVSSATAWAIATGGVTLLLAGIAALVIAYKDMVPWVAQLTREQENELKLRQSIADVSDEAVKNSSKELATVISLGTAIKDQQLSREERLKAVVKYNELAEDGNKIDATQIDNSSLIESAIRRQTDLIVKRSLARAAENEITKIAEESLSDRQFIQDQKENILKEQKAIENQKKGIYDASAAATETMSGEQLKAQKTLSDTRAAGTKEVIRLAEERIKDADLRIKKLYELFGVTDNEVKEVKAKDPVKVKVKIAPVLDVAEAEGLYQDIKKELDIIDFSKLTITTDFMSVQTNENLSKLLDDTKNFVSNFSSITSTFDSKIGVPFQMLGEIIASSIDIKALNDAVDQQRLQLQGLIEYADAVRNQNLDLIQQAQDQEVEIKRKGALELLAIIQSGDEKEIKAIEDKVNKQNAAAAKQVEDTKTNVAKTNKANDESVTSAKATLTDLEDKTKKAQAQAITSSLKIVSVAISAVDAIIDRNIARIDKAIDHQKTAIERARELADKGNSQLLDAEEKKMLKLEELRRKESRKKKAAAISEAVVNTAIGVTNALTTKPAYLAAIMAILAGAMGAVQIGIISSQQFAKGGFTGDGTGQRDNTGHIPVGIVHDNEFVLDKEYTSKNRNELEYIHKNRIPLADIIKNNQMPVMSFNNILGGLQVNSSGQLEERMRAVESAILDLPNRMPQTSMNVDSRGLSIRVTELASKEKNWKR